MPLSRKEILKSVGGYDISMKSCIDYDFWLRVASGGANFHYQNDENFVLYRIRDHSLSSSSPGFCSNGLYSLGKFKDKIYRMTNYEKDIYNHAIGDWIFRRGKSNHEQGNYYIGIKDMFYGLIKNKSDFSYKLSILFLGLFFKASRVDILLKKIKNMKDRIIH